MFRGASTVLLACALVLVPLPAPATAAVVLPFEKRYDAAVYGDFITVGNGVLACPASADCAETQQGLGNLNNNDFVMSRVNAAGLPGAYDSSSVSITVPAGATVAYARLFWGGNAGTLRGPSGAILDRCDISGAIVATPPGEPLTTPTLLRVAAGPVVPVPPQVSAGSPTDLGGPHYYTAEAEVTGLFAGMPTGTPVEVALGNVWAPDGLGCVGGWSLTVVYSFPAPNPAAPTRREIDIYGGHVLQRSSDPDTTITVDDFVRAGTAEVHASVTAYEGDRPTTGDQLQVNGVNIPEPHTGATSNFFISASDGAAQPGYENNLNVDVEEFGLPASVLPEGATSATLTFRTRGDTYVAQQLALSVPVPDLQVTKTAAVSGSVRPGSRVTYTITARNTGPLDYPGAKLVDDLSGAVDDARYAGDATASLGTVTYGAPALRWTGDVPVGQTARITYSVIVDNPVRGDGRLLNDVVAIGDRTTCAGGCPLDLSVAGRMLPISGFPSVWFIAAGLLLVAAGAVLRFRV